MSFWDKESAMKSVYYLMVADGQIEDKEMKIFHELATNLEYEAEKVDELVRSCKTFVDSLADEEEYFEVLQEKADECMEQSVIYDKIGSRLVLWNMMAIAFADGRYCENEKKMIQHFARKVEVEKDIILEMEQIIKTIGDLEEEIVWLEKSNRPYSEISPIMREIIQRKDYVIESATNLIADEILEPVEMPKEKMNERIAQATKTMIDEKVKPGTEEIGEKVQQSWDSIKSSVQKKTPEVKDSVTKGVKFGVAKLINGVRNVSDKKEE